MQQFFANVYTFLTDTFPQAVSEGFVEARTGRILGVLSLNPSTVGLLLQVVFICLIGGLLQLFPKSGPSIVFGSIIEDMYNFFEDILGKKAKKTTKIYVITLFSIIILANISSLLLDLVRIVFVDPEFLTQYITIPTVDITFNIGLAVISVFVMLAVQYNSTGSLGALIHEYLPITGKNVLTAEKGNMSTVAYRLVAGLVKIFDILISMFVGLLDIIGLIAKVISLSARLYGNMLAGGVLLGLLISAINTFTTDSFGYQFPVLAPLILYIQGLLVACIQAFIFPLLVAIFIKIADGEEEEAQA